jgi:hypothetical protein
MRVQRRVELEGVTEVDITDVMILRRQRKAFMREATMGSEYPRCGVATRRSLPQPVVWNGTPAIFEP